MVDIQSKEVIDKVSDDLKIQPAFQIPRGLMDKIQLVYNVNPARVIRSAIGTLVDSAGGTFHTTHATKRTFLIGCMVTTAKDANATSTSTDINLTVLGNNASNSFFIIRYEPLTAGQHSGSISFPEPVELVKNTVIQILHSTAIASIDSSAVVYFYETDPE